MWESCPNESWAPSNVKSVELDALTTAEWLCQSIVKTSTFPSPNASVV